MIPFNATKTFGNTFTAMTGAVMLTAAMCIGSGSARADGKTKNEHLSHFGTIKDVAHDHRRFRHRLVATDDANVDPECRYQHTIDGLIEICPEPHSALPANTLAEIRTREFADRCSPTSTAARPFREGVDGNRE
jgi:hypothetical protein